MGTRADALSNFLDTLSVFWLCWPNLFDEDTGTAEEVEAALFEEWRVFKAHIKRDIGLASAHENKLIEGVNLIKNGEHRGGALLLQREVSNNPELRKLR